MNTAADYLPRYRVITDGGLDFEVKSGSKWLILMDGFEPIMSDAATLSLAHYLYPAAHSIFSVSLLEVIEKPKDTLDDEDLERLFNQDAGQDPPRWEYKRRSLKKKERKINETKRESNILDSGTDHLYGQGNWRDQGNEQNPFDGA